MLRTFDLDDGSVVLIIGSGAGGGTLGNELAQKGIRALILEAGTRIEREQHIDDERQSFAQLALLDRRSEAASGGIPATVRIGPQPQRSLSSPLETGFSLFVVSIAGELVERLESEGHSARSARRSRGLKSGSGTDRGAKRS
jgi:choline dehydrogenase-like flavoprotein